MSTADDKRKEEELWKLMCRSRFSGWFQSSTKVKVKDPKKPLVIPRMNRMQRKLDDAVEWCDANGVPARIVNLKPRQGGSSSWAVARGYHRARSTSATCAILGDDKNTTDKLMAMWRRYGENDTMDKVKAWGNTPTNPHQPSWMSFTHEASLTLETANDPRAGQGGTFQFLLSSETASYRASGHSTGEDVFSAIFACVPELPGTLVIVESTAGGRTGVFYNTYKGAVTLEERKAGKIGNGFIRVFTAWFEFEDYTFDGQDGRRALMDGEAERIMSSLDEDEERLISRFGSDVITPERLAWRRHKIGSPECNGSTDRFKNQYPSDDDEAFTMSGRTYFDDAGIAWQEKHIIVQPKMGIIAMQGRAPSFLARDYNQALFRVWEPPEDGERYLLAADWCVGRQAAGASGELDTNAFGVWRAGRVIVDPMQHDGVNYLLHRGSDASRDRTQVGGTYKLPMLVAACMPDDRSRGKEALERVASLYRMYGECMTVPEINNKDNIDEQLEALGVTNLWTQRQGTDGAKPGQGRTRQIRGFLTTGNASGGGTRKQILDNLETMVREQAFICPCPELLRQLRIFIRNEDGRGEAPAGDHDDWVMMAAIALFTLNAATLYRAPRLGSSVDGWSRERLERSSISPMGV